MSSVLSVVLAATGTGTILLGIWHLSVPRLFGFGQAIGADDLGDGARLGTMHLGPWRYERRRADAVGLAWVMSNAASFVLVSIGLLDLAWALGDRAIPVVLGSVWIAGWWGLRAASQFALGRRRLDVAIALAFAVPGVIHVVTAFAA